MKAMSYYLREPMDRAEKAGAAVDWEECACLLCGSANWSPLVEAPDRAQGGQGLWFMVVQCHDCGLCFTNPRPGPDGIERFYPADYAPHHVAERATQGPRWW